MASSEQITKVAHAVWESMRMAGEACDVFDPCWEALTSEERLGVERWVRETYAFADPDALPVDGLHRAYSDLRATPKKPCDESDIFRSMPKWRRVQFMAARGMLVALQPVVAE